MSTFRVKLTNTAQGLMDTAGQAAGTSLQRTIYVMGPNKVNRKLKDGETFTDSNYWKQFAYPQLPLDQAFIEVVTDDGSVYSSIEEENAYAKVYNKTLTAGQTYTLAGHIIDVLGDTGSYAHMAQITPTVNCKVKINGSAILSLTANVSQVLSSGDVAISSLAFDNSTSGASNGTVEVLLGVRSVSKS